MFDPVDPIAAADLWSRTTAYLTMSNDKQIATGSGILAVHPNGQTFLITALHNLTGDVCPDGIDQDSDLDQAHRWFSYLGWQDRCFYQRPVPNAYGD